MEPRDRVYALLNLEEADRVAYVDFPWGETIDRWRREGLPERAIISEYFQMDIRMVGVDVSPKFDQIVVEEAEDWYVIRDAFGVKVKCWRGRSGTPYPLEAAVETLDEFRERIEPLLDPELPMRVSSGRYPFKRDLERAIAKLQERYFVFVSVLGPFEYARHILGEGVDRILVKIYRDPHLVRYVFDKLSRFLSEVVKVHLELGVDGIWIYDDIAYRNGPFFSPRFYREVVGPAHRRIIERFRARNLPAVLHTDGNVNLLIPQFIEVGFTALQPLEAKAGMDVRELKAKYGDKLAFIGNIDVRALSAGREAIRREVLSKLPVAAEGGGYVVCSDHSVPPTVSLEDYKYFLRLVRRYGRYPLRG